MFVGCVTISDEPTNGIRTASTPQSSTHTRYAWTARMSPKHTHAHTNSHVCKILVLLTTSAVKREHLFYVYLNSGLHTHATGSGHRTTEIATIAVGAHTEYLDRITGTFGIWRDGYRFYLYQYIIGLLYKQNKLYAKDIYTILYYSDITIPRCDKHQITINNTICKQFNKTPC